jgi:diaminohydroxyphosphoribosylaminopyrimidine deaminase/5-amino-6-(5-phosphoribosylamino)uracil reductase
MQSRLLTSARETPLWIIAGEHAPAASETALRQSGAEVLRVAERQGRLDLREAVKILAARGITRLMVEGGAAVASAFIESDLVDQAIFFHSSATIGEGGLPALEPGAARRLDRQLKRISTEAVGSDRKETYERESDHV